MLYIKTYNNGRYDQISYHIGEYMPEADNVVNIQADGTELDHIYNKFSNLPIPNRKSVVTYYGDMAKFIIGNW